MKNSEKIIFFQIFDYFNLKDKDKDMKLVFLSVFLGPLTIYNQFKTGLKELDILKQISMKTTS